MPSPLPYFLARPRGVREWVERALLPEVGKYGGQAALAGMSVWEMQEKAGTSGANSVADYMRRAHGTPSATGCTFGAAGPVIDGQQCGAVALANNGYVITKSFTGIIDQVGTVLIWFKPNDAFSGNTGTQKHLMTGGPREFYFSSSSSRLLYFLSDDATSVFSIATSWQSQWYCAAVSFDGTTLRMYIDGVSQSAGQNGTGKNFFGNLATLKIGVNGSLSSGFPGSLGPCAVIPAALPANSIQYLYLAARNGV